MTLTCSSQFAKSHKARLRKLSLIHFKDSDNRVPSKLEILPINGTRRLLSDPKEGVFPQKKHQGVWTLFFSIKHVNQKSQLRQAQLSLYPLSETLWARTEKGIAYIRNINPTIAFSLIHTPWQLVSDTKPGTIAIPPSSRICYHLHHFGFLMHKPKSYFTSAPTLFSTLLTMSDILPSPTNRNQESIHVHVYICLCI